MKSTRLLPLAVAAVSFAASAHAARPLAAAADANAPVAPLQYQSVFPDHAPRDDDQPSPDKVWIAANRQLAGASAPVDHAAHGAAQQLPASQPVQAPATYDAGPAANPHHAHHGHAMPKKEQ